MKAAKIITNAEVTSAATPDAGYRSLYPKSDGWYAKDSEGNELKISSIVVNGNSEDKIEFGSAFTVTVVDDVLYIDLSFAQEDSDTDGDYLPIHGNEGHIVSYVTQADVDNSIQYYNDTIVANLHSQDTDQYLDYGGSNQVSAAALKALVDANASMLPRGVIRTALAETNVTVDYENYIADAESNNVSFVLPAAADSQNVAYTFRHGGGTYAMTIERSGLDVINYDGIDIEGITTDTESSWVKIMSDGTKWYVLMDNGLLTDTDV